MRKLKFNNGFTLAEILVVIGILAIVGVMMVAIFISTLRGSNKSQILSTIKQNGQSVLEAVDKNIRGAENVVCPIDANPSATLVIENEGLYTRYRFVPPASSLNGNVQKDYPSKQIDLETNTLETDPQFLSRICNPADPMVQSAVLTDTSLELGVSVNTGSFRRQQLSGFRDSVTIQFVLSPGLNAPEVVAGQIDPVTFQTTIELR